MKGHKLLLLLISILASLVYLNTLSNELVWDDKRFIREWTDIRSFKNIPKYFLGKYAPRHDGKYRPLKGVILTIDYQLWKENVLGYHLQAIAIHLAASILVYLIALEVMTNAELLLFERGRSFDRVEKFPIKFSTRLPAPKRSDGGQASSNNNWLGAFATAALFAIHPIHVEAITFITSSTDILGIVFMLTAFYVYITKLNQQAGSKKYLVITLVLATLAYLTNEITLVLLPLFILYDLCFRKLAPANANSFFKSYLPHLTLVTIYLIVRFGVLRISEDANYMIDQAKITYLIMFEVIVKYLQLLILPLNLNVTHLIRADISSFIIDIDPNLDLGNVFDLQMIFSIAVVVALIILGLYLIRKKPLVTFAVFWFFIALIPVSNIFPLPALMTERYAYLASFGFCLLSGLILSKLFTKKSIILKTVTLTVFLGLTGFYSYQTFTRNKGWQNSHTLWSQAVKEVKKSMVANGNLAAAYLEEENYGLAIKYYQTAERYNYYQLEQPFTGLGKTYFKNDQLDLAYVQFEKAVKSNPKAYEAYYFLGQIHERRGDTDLATEAYQKSISANPQFYDSYVALGKVYAEIGLLDKSIEEYEVAVNLSPKNVHAYNNLSVLYSKKGDYELARTYLQKALEADPDNEQVKQNLEKLNSFIKKRNAPLNLLFRYFYI